MLTLKKLICYFADFGWVSDFEQVKTLVAILLPLNKLKKLTTKLPWEKLDAYAFFFFFLAIASCHRLSTLASQTCEGILQFFNSLTGDLWDAVLRQRLPTLVPREAEDFHRGNNYSKHVSLSTYLAWLQQIYYNSRLVFIDVKTAEILLVVKNLLKTIEQQPHW